MLKTNNTQERDNLSCIRANIHTLLERPNINPLYDRDSAVCHAGRIWMKSTLWNMLEICPPLYWGKLF